MMEVVEDNACEEKITSGACLSSSTDNVVKTTDFTPNCEGKQHEAENACTPEALTEEVAESKDASHHHGSSKWTNFTKALKLGPSFDPAVPQHIACNAHHLPPFVDKRGSLGKLFRHGLSLNSRSSSYSVDSKEMMADVPAGQDPELGHHKKASLWKVLKHGGKSPNCVSEANLMSGEGNNSDTEDQKVIRARKRLSLGKLLKTKKYTDSLALEKSKTEVASGGDDSLPPIHMRTRSLGKYFRYNKDSQGSESLAGYFKKSHKNKDRPTSARPSGEVASDEARNDYNSELD